MSQHFKVGDRVTVTKGAFRGARGRIIQRAHLQVRPTLDWVVKFDEPVHVAQYFWFEAGVHSRELGPWTTPESSRPLLFGALQHPMRLAR